MMNSAGLRRRAGKRHRQCLLPRRYRRERAGDQL